MGVQGGGGGSQVKHLSVSTLWTKREKEEKLPWGWMLASQHLFFCLCLFSFSSWERLGCDDWNQLHGGEGGSSWRSSVCGDVVVCDVVISSNLSVPASLCWLPCGQRAAGVIRRVGGCCVRP